MVGYRVATFNDCIEASDELKQVRRQKFLISLSTMPYFTLLIFNWLSMDQIRPTGGEVAFEDTQTINGFFLIRTKYFQMPCFQVTCFLITFEPQFLTFKMFAPVPSATVIAHFGPL